MISNYSERDLGDLLNIAVAILVDDYGWDENDAFNAIEDLEGNFNSALVNADGDLSEAGRFLAGTANMIAEEGHRFDQSYADDVDLFKKEGTYNEGVNLKESEKDVLEITPEADALVDVMVYLTDEELSLIPNDATSSADVPEDLIQKAEARKAAQKKVVVLSSEFNDREFEAGLDKLGIEIENDGLGQEGLLYKGALYPVDIESFYDDPSYCAKTLRKMGLKVTKNQHGDLKVLKERADKNTKAGAYVPKIHYEPGEDKKKSKLFDLKIGDVVLLDPKSFGPKLKNGRDTGLYAVVVDIKKDDTIVVEAENGSEYKIDRPDHIAKIKESVEKTYVVGFEDEDKEYFTIEVKASSEMEAQKKARKEVTGDPKKPHMVRVSIKESTDEEPSKKIYKIVKAGTKAHPEWRLMTPDGSELSDMYFDNPEQARAYAKKKGYTLKEMTQAQYDKQQRVLKKIKSDLEGTTITPEEAIDALLQLGFGRTKAIQLADDWGKDKYLPHSEWSKVRENLEESNNITPDQAMQFARGMKNKGVSMGDTIKALAKLYYGGDDPQVIAAAKMGYKSKTKESVDPLLGDIVRLSPAISDSPDGDIGEVVDTPKSTADFIIIEVDGITSAYHKSDVLEILPDEDEEEDEITYYDRKEDLDRIGTDDDPNTWDDPYGPYADDLEDEEVDAIRASFEESFASRGELPLLHKALEFTNGDMDAAEIIAGWYRNEGADASEINLDDISDLLWAASDPEEIRIVAAATGLDSPLGDEDEE